MAPTTFPLPLPSTAQELPGLLELSQSDLLAWLGERGEKPWRAGQLRRWLLSRGAQSFDEMTDLPKTLRQELQESFVPFTSRIARHLEAGDGTHKLLLELRDKSLVECVLIQEDNRRTACISTQVGCGMGCVFCASGLDGLQRNLTAAEILDQLLRLRVAGGGWRVAGEEGEMMDKGRAAKAAHSPATRHPPPATPSLTHIVVMGMGEPLANLDNLLSALELATAPDGLGIGGRHVTISTVGLPARIRQLADADKSYHLAVSLHAANDALRSRIVPTNAKTGLDAILAAADYFFAKTGRQVTYEYVLLAGLNDSPRQARELARLLHGRHGHVNVIPFNEVSGLPYARPTPQALTEFLAPLRQAGISVKVRKRKGAQIDAACGQLRRTSSQ